MIAYRSPSPSGPLAIYINCIGLGYNEQFDIITNSNSMAHVHLKYMLVKYTSHFFVVEKKKKGKMNYMYSCMPCKNSKTLVTDTGCWRLCFKAKAARHSFELYASFLAGVPQLPRSILRPTLARTA